MSTQPNVRVISLGAGVQSSVMALLAAAGEIGPMPDCAIFADTKAEPGAVYSHLDWLEGELPFPVHRVTQGNLLVNTLAGTNHLGHTYMSVPTLTVDPQTGKAGRTRRQCTHEYKLKPILKQVRRLMGLEYRQPVRPGMWAEQWIGISTDEATRVKPPREPYIVGRWPLIELGMSRTDCLRWFGERYPGWELPRSACVFCPYHSAGEWRAMRESDPESWATAVKVDERLREPEMVKRMKGEMYLLWKPVPLRTAVLDGRDAGQLGLFDEECEGMCGV